MRYFSVLPVAALVVGVLAVAQAVQLNPQQPMAGGESSGGAHAAVHDAQNRPITAGGFVKLGPVVF
ncbi:MAG TPA: CRTAC1 family protein, partial [Acidobacteriaceae bacterium]|nr:CRTAC1 family protein [Acidobacteriaceae bacterium]